ncbi:MAG: hypothetical protein WC632_07190 [Candidatus Margulisiibacteriota bacterium]
MTDREKDKSIRRLKRMVSDKRSCWGRKYLALVSLARLCYCY